VIDRIPGTWLDAVVFRANVSTIAKPVGSVLYDSAFRPIHRLWDKSKVVLRSTNAGTATSPNRYAWFRGSTEGSGQVCEVGSPSGAAGRDGHSKSCSIQTMIRPGPPDARNAIAATCVELDPTSRRDATTDTTLDIRCRRQPFSREDNVPSKRLWQLWMSLQTSSCMSFF
jgi:hypothetical protein